MQIKDLNKKEIEVINFLSNYKSHSAVSISGGKDSLVALDLSIRAGIKTVVHCNTSMNFPGTEKYLKELENFYDIEIIQTKPPREFFDLVNDIGYPSRRLRWCCEVYKFGPLTNYVQKEKVGFLITGIRAEESRKRVKYKRVSKNPLIPAIQINPILDWTTNEIWEYINTYKLPYHTLYDKGYKRLGCWMCPFQNEDGFKRLKTNFPILYKDLKNSILKNVKKFGKVGVRDISDYVKKFGWTKNALPIRNIIVGLIEFKKNINFTHFYINCKDSSDLSKICLNLKLLEEKTEKLRINEKELSIEFISKELDYYKILIFCEKQVNCIGCGACQSICPNSAIKIENNRAKIDFSNCTYCYQCLSSSRLKGACIARNYLPIRKKFELIDLNHENSGIRKKFLNISNNLGLIKTRKSIEEIKNKLEVYFKNNYKQEIKSFKINGSIQYITDRIKLDLHKNYGFSILHIDCKNNNVEDEINLLLNSFNKS